MLITFMVLFHTIAKTFFDLLHFFVTISRSSNKSLKFMIIFHNITINYKYRKIKKKIIRFVADLTMN